MILTLLKAERIQTLVLPEKVNGQFWIQDTDANGKLYDFIGVEGIGGEWLIKSNRKVELIDENDCIIKKTAIKPLHF